MSGDKPTAATSSSWNHDDFDVGVEVPYCDTFDEGELEVISRGLIPDEMEDHWFVYLEEDTLHFVRAWTGYTMYRVHLQRENGSRAQIVRSEARVASGGDPKWHAALLRFLMRRCLLGDESVPLPSGPS